MKQKGEGECAEWENEIVKATYNIANPVNIGDEYFRVEITFNYTDITAPEIKGMNLVNLTEPICTSYVWIKT